MKEIDKKQFKKHGKDIYYHNSQRGWAIVIMPDRIRIDTYHKEAHIHFKIDGIHIPIKYRCLEEVGLIVESHIEKYKCINKNKLKEELL
jgi:hypothetical protein